jgi:tetratricopeptide (TPR) repeat protein
VASTSWLICVTRRNVESGFVGPPEGTRRIDVRNFDRSEASALAQAAARDAPIPPHELDILVERSDGNPLFLRELVAAALNGDAVDALPESVEEVIAARIDRLSGEDRYLLRRLSVLGQSFSRQLVREVVDGLPDEDDPAWARLEEFITADGRGTLAFRNALLRDGAYDGLTFRLRRELHARAGDTILRTATGRNGEQPELLSFHYLHAQRFSEAWTYSQQAAERARAVYANFEAAEFYERALAAGRRLAELDAGELSRVHEALGDARFRAGGYIEAAAAYRAARRLVADDPLAEARLVLKIARVQGWLDRYANALRWITKGLRIIDGADEEAGRGQRAELLGWYGRYCQEGGHHARAIKWCTRAVEEAEAAGVKGVLAEALLMIDWAKMELGQLEDPVNMRRALALCEEIEDLPGQGKIFNGLGIVAYFRGEWEEAVEWYRRSQDIDRRTGNPVFYAFSVFNIGEIYLDQGHLDQAEESFEIVSRSWRAAGYRSGEADLKGKLARIAAGQHRYDDALHLFNEAIDEFRHIGSYADALEAQARLAECLLTSGDTTTALAVVDDALSQAHALGGTPPQIPLLQRVRGAALFRTGEREAAAVAFERSLEAAGIRQNEYEAALTMRVMAEGTPDGDRREELRTAASATLAKLGVVWTPDLLGSGSSLAAPVAARVSPDAVA